MSDDQQRVSFTCWQCGMVTPHSAAAVSHHMVTGHSFRVDLDDTPKTATEMIRQYKQGMLGGTWRAVSLNDHTVTARQHYGSAWRVTCSECDWTFTSYRASQSASIRQLAERAGQAHAAHHRKDTPLTATVDADKRPPIIDPNEPTADDISLPLDGWLELYAGHLEHCETCRYPMRRDACSYGASVRRTLYLLRHAHKVAARIEWPQ